MIRETLQSKIREICRRNKIIKLGVFGSTARGEETADSDVDLLVELSEPLELIKFIQLEDQFAEILERKVDLATEESLHPLIRENVLRDLKILCESETRQVIS